MSTPEDQIKKWEFFCKELNKANDILDIIEMIFKHISMRNNAYNHFFALILDSLTTKVFLILAQIFDVQDDSLRLTRIITNKSDISRAKELEKEAEPFIGVRHKRFAHLSKNEEEINYDSNFILMNEHNSKKIREILNEVGGMLRRWGVEHNNGTVIADRWGNINSSAQVLFENLKEHDYLTSVMSTYERHNHLENMRKRNEK